MNQKKVGSILTTICLILLCLLLVNLIYFRFVSSYPYNEERITAKECLNYAKKSGKELLTPLNSFMYQGNKLYACAVNDIYEKVIILNEEGDVLLSGNYRTLQHNMAMTGTKEVGLYQNQIVLISTRSDEYLEIKYYDMKSGEEVFSLQPEENENEEITME